MTNYTIELTALAEAIAKKHRSVEELKVLVSSEVQKLLDAGMASVDQLGFTTVSFGSIFDKDEPKWLVTPKGNSVLLVDSASYEEYGKLKKGRFAGKILQIPTGDSE